MLKTSPSQNFGYPLHFSLEDIQMCELVRPYTKLTAYRIKSLIAAVRYIVKAGVSGAFVDCGVWKGGSALTMIYTLMALKSQIKDSYLYDTFAGMAEPTDVDVSVSGFVAKKKFLADQISPTKNNWCLSDIEEVKRVLFNTGYNKEALKFVKGKVEDTIPQTIPNEISLLRLDTDWYTSTKHELTHLFPLLKSGGVLIIDDYGEWEGARKAVDEYILDNNLNLLLTYVDTSCVITVKP